MNYRFLIINSLLLLYWERKIENNPNSSVELVKTIMTELDIAKNAETDDSKDVFLSLHSLILKICSHPKEEIDKELLIRQIKLMACNDQYVTEIITESVNRELDVDEIKLECLSLSRSVREEQKKLEFGKMLKDIARDYLYSGKSFDCSQAAREIIERTENFAVEREEGIGSISGVVNFVDFTSEEELAKLLFEANNEISPEEILKLPYQGLTRMTGRQAGIRRGETVLVGGLSHHGKSVLTMAMTRGIAMYTTPHLHDKARIPTILIISSENDLTVNIRELYEQCYVNTYFEKPKTTPSEQEAALFIKECFGKQGWKTYMVRVNPDEFSIHDFQDLIYQLEASNHEIILCTFDYLSMMTTKGIVSSGVTGSEKQALWCRTRNMFTVRKTAFISPHQLSTEALNIERDRPSKFLDEILNRGYYKDCKSLYQEVDFEINIQKITIDGITYIYYGRGKHRGVNDTPEEHKRCCYQVGPLGILDDINGEDKSMPKPGRAIASQDDFFSSVMSDSSEFV